VELIPADPEQADAVFIEDTAVVLDELAVITRPGAASRRGELGPVAARLERERRLVRLDAPATLDGGDVIVAGRKVFVGQTTRSNGEGLAALRAALSPIGYDVIGVPVTGCLHLKSAATVAAPGVILLNPHWVDAGSFQGYDTVAVHPEEPGAANVLRVGQSLVQDAAYPRTRKRLLERGLTVRTVDLSELAKAEGAVTCCSLIVSRGSRYL
jgi:dimethylargininase